MKVWQFASMKRLPPCPHCRRSLVASGQKVNPQARGAQRGSGESVHRRGSFKRKHDGRRIRRFGCKVCRRTFSLSTTSVTFGQHRPDVNQPVALLLVSLVTQTRTAQLLHINRKTVVRKLVFGAALARREHGVDAAKLVGRLTHLQFDDVETAEHTKLKPLAISLLVDANTRYIIAFDVSSMPAKGHLAHLSRRKYGPRPDDRPRGWHNVLSAAGLVGALGAEILSDSHPSYPEALRRAAPHLRHRQVKSRRATVAGQGEMKQRGFDPLYSLNHTAAMLRANINRLIRRTWCITKRPDRLADHLALYARFHNTVLLKEQPEALTKNVT